MSIADLLEALDGYGLIVTDDELINEALEQMGLSRDTEIPIPI